MPLLFVAGLKNAKKILRSYSTLLSSTPSRQRAQTVLNKYGEKISSTIVVLKYAPRCAHAFFVDPTGTYICIRYIRFTAERGCTVYSRFVVTRHKALMPMVTEDVFLIITIREPTSVMSCDVFRVTWLRFALTKYSISCHAVETTIFSRDRRAADSTINDKRFTGHRTRSSYSKKKRYYSYGSKCVNV